MKIIIKDQQPDGFSVSIVGLQVSTWDDLKGVLAIIRDIKEKGLI